MLELIKDVAGYEAFHSPPGKVAVVRELLQEVKCVHHILRQLRRLVLAANLRLHHGAHILPCVHQKLLNVLRMELAEESNAAGNERWAVQHLTLRRFPAQQTP